ncbi:hypothetical protein BH20ACI1_BH20ACI1_17620 [soil metagenome]
MKHKINLTLILIIGLLLVIGCANSGERAAKDAKNDSLFQQPLKEAMLKNMGKLPANWQELEFSKFEKNAVTINLYYSKMPSGLREVERDTKSIAQIVLNTLVSQNYNPREEWLALFVHARKRETGATGANLIRSFGKTHYDFNSDQLIFDAAK